MKYVKRVNREVKVTLIGRISILEQKNREEQDDIASFGFTNKESISANPKPVKLSHLVL